MKSFSTSTLIGEVYVILYTVGGAAFPRPRCEHSESTGIRWLWQKNVGMEKSWKTICITRNHQITHVFFWGGGKLDILQIYGKFFGEFLLSPLFGLVII